MSEPRKNHMSIDGGQVKEDDHVASYKPIPESDTDFRSSKTSLSKSKEKTSPDGAEEKLLSKEDEAKIVRVDMADAKYVVGDHRNGDANIELDANKRQFSGLTKEELMKYADDPFWVNLRWCMFVLFWTMWLAMLAGAITIIVRAPKCPMPTDKEWFEKYSVVESDGASYTDIEAQLPLLQSHSVNGIFLEVPTYDADSDLLTKFKAFVDKAKTYSVKVIVELTPNFVLKSHPWFVQSENRSAIYSDYFLWAPVKSFDAAGNPGLPNNWKSTLNSPAWSYSPTRKEFYLHQYGEDQPDLNFRNERVVREFTSVLEKWVAAGAAGVRLKNARTLLVNSSFPNEELATGRGSQPGADLGSYDFWRHKQTADFDGLEALLKKFGEVVNATGDSGASKVFTIKESGVMKELFLLDRKVSFLRPPSAAAVPVGDVSAAAATLTDVLKTNWPLLQLKGDAESGPELALFSMLLPATPVLDLHQIQHGDLNDTTMSQLTVLREDASVQHGNHSIVAVPAANANKPQLLACARWKAAHTGYVAVFNPRGEAVRANLTGVPSLPSALTVHLVSKQVSDYTNYTKNFAEHAYNVLVPAKSTVVLSYVPLDAAES